MFRILRFEQKDFNLFVQTVLNERINKMGMFFKVSGWAHSLDTDEELWRGNLCVIFFNEGESYFIISCVIHELFMNRVVVSRL